jgi:hypothetical protein
MILDMLCDVAEVISFPMCVPVNRDGTCSKTVIGVGNVDRVNQWANALVKSSPPIVIGPVTRGSVGRLEVAG